MNNLIDIQSQIEKLQKQANEIKSKEFSITVKDLQTAKPSKGAKAGKAGRGRPAGQAKVAKAVKKASTPVAAKYRGPNGETWSGRGLTPKWLASEIALGKSKESFLIGA